LTGAGIAIVHGIHTTKGAISDLKALVNGNDDNSNSAPLPILKVDNR